MKDSSSDSLSDYHEGLILLFEQKPPHIDSSANLHKKYRPVAGNQEKYLLNNLDNSGLKDALFSNSLLLLHLIGGCTTHSNTDTYTQLTASRSPWTPWCPHVQFEGYMDQQSRQLEHCSPSLSQNVIIKSGFPTNPPSTGFGHLVWRSLSRVHEFRA